MLRMLRQLFGNRESSETLGSAKDPTEICDDCGAEDGELHDLFCTRERCPFCQNQLITCDCIHTVLNLSPEESNAVDEYIDDSIEPLFSIMERWKAALNQKGRIPFRGRKLQPTADDLLRMAGRGELGAVQKLLALGVPVDAANEVEFTALKSAARNGQFEMMKLLIESGANIHHRDQYGHTALHCAVSWPASDRQKQAECVHFLIDQGAQIDARDDSNGTPLMSAAWFGGSPSVDTLLKAGADQTLRDNKGRTAADLAEQRGHVDIAAKLRVRY